MSDPTPLPGPGSRLRVPWAALERASAAEIAALVGQHPAARIVVVGCGDADRARRALAALCRAAAGRVIMAVGAGADEVAPALCAAFVAAGVVGVEAVADPRTGLGPAWAAAAERRGLAIILRWTLATGGLVALDALRRGQRPPPVCRELVIEPWLPSDDRKPTRALPDLARVRSAWPTRSGPAGGVFGPGGPQLVRSLLWPAALDVAADATEPAPTAAVARAAALLTLRPGASKPSQPARAAPNPTAWFEPRAPEARGLALGLRSAWRLHVPRAELPALQAALARHDLVCAASAGGHERDVGGGWTSLDADTGAVLVVVARSPAVARRCLALELANLARPAPRTAAEMRASVLATLATHRALGAAYGYPPCCVEAFCDAHAEALHGPRSGDNALAVLRAWLRTRRFDARLDVLAGPLGDAYRTPLRHLPCRFDCPASLRLHARLAPRRVAGPLASPPGTKAAAAVVVFADGSFVRLPGAHALAARDGSTQLSGGGAWEPSLTRALQPHASQLAQAFAGATATIRAGHVPMTAGAPDVAPLPDAVARAVRSPFPLVLPFA